MVEDVDQLLQGAGWQAEELVVGKECYARSHVLYKRPVIDVIQDLIGNPAFKDFMHYAPKCYWTSQVQQLRVYGEMWTGNWLWQHQVSSFCN